MNGRYPKVLGIDEGPFRKGQKKPVPVVGVIMEGSRLIEGIVLGSFPVDGEGATDYLAGWIGAMRWHAALQAVLLPGSTLAGLGIVDIRALSKKLAVPVVAVTRQSTEGSDLPGALTTAGFPGRIRILERAPKPWRIREGVHAAAAGAGEEETKSIVEATLLQAKVPEPIRVAHLIATALVRGASHGRV